ncbi:DNA circularization protein [Shigella sonnei]|nr:multidrug DMT transporter permease [Shigella sonnei]EKY7370451.1 DNA circularization protein [Shigella sonnei]EME4986228.1 DNA circularization protein [Shigella sonnei]
MSWADNMQDASFRGVRFDVVSTRDSGNKDVAVYEYPYKDGADIDDMGNKPRNARLTALFWGDDYETRLQAFLAALDKRGHGELIHPVFGSMPKMQCLEYQVSHDAESVDYCSVEVVFLQGATEQPFFGSDFPLSKADTIFNQVQSSLDYAQNLIDDVLAPMRYAKKQMARAKYMASTALNMVTVLRSDITGFISSTTDFVNYPGAFIRDVQTALSLKSEQSKSTLSNTPGSYAATTTSSADVASIIMADWSESVTNLNAVARLPAQLASGEIAAPMPLPANIKPSDVIELSTLTTLQAAVQIAQDAADLLSTEDVIAQLPPEDIEAICNDVRTALQTSITQHRELYASDTQNVSASTTPVGLNWQPVVNELKDIALSVQQLSAAVITQRPPLISRVADSDTNLHLLAHRWYGDYTRAMELKRLNPQIRNPNDIQSGEILHAYSR